VYFFVSLGSNIKPEHHIAEALETLADRFSPLISFPVVHTPPCDIESENEFLNGLVLFYSDLTEEQIKEQFNALEERSGRDRSDPARSEKDRTLDLDILAVQDTLDLSVCNTFDEPYTQQCVRAAELLEGKAPPCARVSRNAVHCLQVDSSLEDEGEDDKGEGHALRKASPCGATPSGDLPCATISIAGNLLGHRPAAIYRDHTRGDILVVEDTVDSLLQRFKTTFHSK